MNEKERLLLALQQINNITNLIQDNQYKQFLYGKLISVEVELQRQLTNLTYHERRRFQGSSTENADDAEQQRSQLQDFAVSD
jgi:predicted RNA-binding protein with EMAP domain